MRPRLAAAITAIAAVSLLAGAANGAPKRTATTIQSRGHTVLVTRAEDGKTHTRIIIQKRSYLDPGTESFPGENTGFDGHAFAPTQHATSVLDNTAAGGFGYNQSALPGPFTLPSKNNPWISD